MKTLVQHSDNNPISDEVIRENHAQHRCPFSIHHFQKPIHRRFHRRFLGFQCEIVYFRFLAVSCAQSNTSMGMICGTSSRGSITRSLKTFAAVYSDQIDRPWVSEDEP